MFYTCKQGDLISTLLRCCWDIKGQEGSKADIQAIEHTDGIKSCLLTLRSLFFVKLLLLLLWREEEGLSTQLSKGSHTGGGGEHTPTVYRGLECLLMPSTTHFVKLT